ncbi:MAG: TraB/GumN family protein [Woeseiaceae bacterium]|nr:TraB/GumN family protein [Woeseiaceae bacterium]
MHKFLILLLLAASAAAADHPVSMWRVDGEQNTIYLLGSVHLLRKQDHPLPAVIEAAYEDAEALVMELDMDDLDPAAIQSISNRLGMLPEGKTLRDVMGDELYREAAGMATAIDIPFEMLSRTEPWFAAITIEQMALLRIGFNPLYGIEMHMAMKASQDNKEIEGLETVEQQLTFLDSLSLDAQKDLLMQTLAESGEIELIMDDLIQAWRHGDVAWLEEQVLKEMTGFDELYDAIVVRRNQAWVESIVELLDDEDDYLIVVGALHLVGEDGVPALLSARGIRTGQMNESL